MFIEIKKASLGVWTIAASVLFIGCSTEQTRRLDFTISRNANVPAAREKTEFIDAAHKAVQEVAAENGFVSVQACHEPPAGKALSADEKRCQIHSVVLYEAWNHPRAWGSPQIRMAFVGIGEEPRVRVIITFKAGPHTQRLMPALSARLSDAIADATGPEVRAEVGEDEFVDEIE